MWIISLLLSCCVGVPKIEQETRRELVSSSTYMQERHHLVSGMDAAALCCCQANALSE